jgi:hypothetical protein
MNLNRARWGLKIFALIIVAVAAVGLAVMTLWNWLAPALFGWHPISFVQAVGLLLLCRILFGRLRGGPGAHLHWRGRLAQRLEQMTPEEREKFRAGMRGRCHRQSSSQPESEGEAGQSHAPNPG